MLRLCAPTSASSLNRLQCHMNEATEILWLAQVRAHIHISDTAEQGKDNAMNAEMYRRSEG